MALYYQISAIRYTKGLVMNDKKEKNSNYDPASEVKQKILFLVIAVVVLLILKYVVGF